MSEEMQWNDGHRAPRSEVALAFSTRGADDMAFAEINHASPVVSLENHEWGKRPTAITQTMVCLQLKADEGEDPVQVLVDVEHVDELVRLLVEGKAVAQEHTRTFTDILDNGGELRQVAKPVYASSADEKALPN